MCRSLPSAVGTSPSQQASNYFTLGRIDEDQAQDYAKRKGWDERDDEMVGGCDEVDKALYGIKLSFIPLYFYIL